MFNRTIEIWFCPPLYQIEEHSHPKEDIQLMFLFGEALFKSFSHRKCAIQTYFAKSPRDTFMTFTVDAGDIHTFTVSKSWLVFLNIAKWKVGNKPTSAADDFQLTHTNL